MSCTLFRRLFFIFLLLSLTLLIACHKTDGADGNENSGTGTSDDENLNAPIDDKTEPEFTKFADIVYLRPDTDDLLSLIEGASEKILLGEAEYSEMLSAIREIEAPYSNFLTMQSYLSIATAIDATDEFYFAENELLTEVYPKIVQALENLFVAAASSKHAERFEEDYLGVGLIAEYGEGGIYTEKVVELLQSEAELELKSASLSPENVEITYEKTTATYEAIEASLAQKYGRSSLAYERAIIECEELYFEARTRIMIPILVELFRVRRLIADELGYDSYATFAYDTLYHDYDPSVMDGFLSDIGRYVVPVYADLYNEVFYDYFYSENMPHLSRGRMLNLLSDAYEAADPELFEIYSYMLSAGYYSVERYKLERSPSAFTTYLADYSSPFVFMSTNGYIPDIGTMSHEFGHFAEAYINHDAPASLDLHEVSSQALELLTTELLDDILTTPEYQYLLYYNLENALLALIYQGFYAKFECEAYKLEYDEISEERLSQIVKEVSRDMGLVEQDLSAVLIEHIMLYPFYVQSYCTSMVAALDIYFAECENEGRGIEIYMDLIKREEMQSFTDELSSVGINSPFAENRLKDIANRVYYKINGYYFYRPSGGWYNAA